MRACSQNVVAPVPTVAYSRLAPLAGRSGGSDVDQPVAGAFDPVEHLNDVGVAGDAGQAHGLAVLQAGAARVVWRVGRGRDADDGGQQACRRERG